MSEKSYKKYYIKNMYGGEINTSIQELINTLVTSFFDLQLNMKLYHWNTSSHPRHLASDKFGSEFAPLVDKFVEVFIGKYKVKPNVQMVNISNNLQPNYDNNNFEYLTNKLKELEELRNKISDNSLLNIYDEMLGLINQVLYLYDLK